MLCRRDEDVKARSESFVPAASSDSRDCRRRDGRDIRTRVIGEGDVSGQPVGRTSPPKVKRLVANQHCFGLDALAFRTGAARVLARLGAPTSSQVGIDIRELGRSFQLDATASWTLLRALRDGGLLQSDGAGHYHPTARFREYAHACVVAPLSRTRAKALIGRAIEIATRINDTWARNPFQIHELAVAGSFMSRSDPLPDLSLWLLLEKRPETRALRRKASSEADHAVQQIVAALRALSSFVVVHVARDRKELPRPFILVFEAVDEAIVRPPPVWERVREWGASFSRRLVSS
jgi:hypothetical protein